MARAGVRLTPLVLAAAFAGLVALPIVGDRNLAGFGLRLLELMAMTYSLNLVTGFLGYVDFGHVVFYGIGAYATAVTLAASQAIVVPLALLVVPGALAALVFGILVGYPTLRLRGAYFAIATFSINEAVLATVLNVEALGGSEGFPLARYARFDLLHVYYVLLAFTALLAAASYGILRTRVGLALQAIREDEDVAEAQAVRTVPYKVFTYAAAGAAAAVVGGLVGVAHVLVSPEYFEVSKGIEQFVIMMIGGPGTALGPLVGSLIYFVIKDSLIIRYPHLHLVFFGVIIVLIVLFLPAGLIGYFRERSRRLRTLLE
jgi:branched-chain amino acid transport system permease protein